MIVKLNITPMKLFIGKVLPEFTSEYFILEHFTKYNKRKLILDYLDYIDKNAGTTFINYEMLVHMFVIFDKVLTRNIPVVNKGFLGYKVKKLIRTGNNLGIEIEYEFEE